MTLAERISISRRLAEVSRLMRCWYCGGHHA